ncbi:hypothetical protein KZO01_26660 [Kurthia zopfii]|uniref:Ferric iron reductase protein FhuF n=1 Tax=Kurthia zopfii TaxID=1650 RepID=A0A8B4Q7A2_9BACL|nr:siderophore-iron reductase FhuF [Kurthia zopfii]PWI21811.1 siderophore-iron reductase FhuF [Kurthia zopfii]TDR34085.1 ferric iron reductase protein FhuF [Kurthia zopfii]GEK32357.1 hypothetical protein KZO01_26660 [Kurthia zopfii]STX08516.1 Uncharacterized Fe-S protein [Kurthia zopfii]
MSGLSQDQLQQLHSYSNYVDEEQTFLFNLNQILQDDFLEDAKNIFKAVSQSDQDAVAISYFTRRYGMFVAMQFYMLTVYDEMWDGELENLQFGVREEFGRPSLCMFTRSEDWIMIDEDERQQAVSKVLTEQCHQIFTQLRKLGGVSPLTHWENVFGYMLWHYHTLSSSPATEDEAIEYLQILENAETWQGISEQSKFSTYTGGNHPSNLINVPVRKSCCFSKDVPGLLKCGFCPL